MNTWFETTLKGKIHIKHGFAFKGEYFVKDGKYIVLTPGNFNEVGGFRIRAGKEKYYNGEIPTDYIHNKDDLIVAMTEQGEGLLGSAAIVPLSDAFLHNQRIGLIKVDENEIDKKFLYYLFNTSLVRQQIRNSSSGTKVRHTSPERMYRVKVSLPEVYTQRKIAAILSAYDDLIENNKRRIAILENMAEEIYREWFVRFRFPGWKDAVFVKGIPKGWEFIELGEMCTIKGGKRLPQGHVLSDIQTKHPYIKGRDIKHGKVDISKLQFIKNQTYEKISNYTVKTGDICITIVANIGDVGFVTNSLNNANLTENAVKLEQIRNDVTVTYLLYTLSQIYYKNYMELLSSGAAQSKLGIYKLKKVSLVLPDQSMQNHFDEIIKSIMQQQETLAMTNLNIKKTKESLLPRLISGKLSVEDLDICGILNENKIAGDSN